MKNLILALIITISVVSFASAQQKEHLVQNKVVVKRTATAGQRVHNVFHPRHKHYSGYKVRHKTRYKKM